MIILEEIQESRMKSSKDAFIILQYIFAIFTTIILIFFAGFREIGLDPDSQTYEWMVQSIDFSNFAYFHQIEIEPSFYLISHFAHLLFGDAIRGTFIIYAILGVTLKMLGIFRLSPIPLLSVVFYISYYYPLHECTQIRVGVASAIFLLSISDITNRKPKKYLVKTIAAIFFHFQAIIMLPLYLIVSKNIPKWIYFSLPILGISLSFFNDYLFGIVVKNLFILNFFPSIISQKFLLYVDFAQRGVFSNINVFNLYNISLIGIYYFSLININKFKSDIDVTMIKILGFSTFIFPFLRFFPFFAFRISEFLSIVVVILLASIVIIFKQKKLIIFFVLIYSLIALYATLYINKLLKF